jgi:hypothetical protein
MRPGTGPLKDGAELAELTWLMTTVRRVLHAEHQTRLRRVRRLSKLLDNALKIPFTNFRIGLDPIIGLVPGLGDVIGMAASSYIVIEAQRMGVPRSVLARMILNVVVDAAVGSIPAAGDVFDFAWKCSAKNVRLLEQWVAEHFAPVK